MYFKTYLNSVFSVHGTQVIFSCSTSFKILNTSLY